jgi:hypothetical protein
MDAVVAQRRRECNLRITALRGQMDAVRGELDEDATDG